MSYELITQHNSRNFTPAAAVPATYGLARTIDSITIHWWGLPEWNATFFGTVDFLCTNKKPTSAHEVIEAGRVAVIVNHGDASWAAGNAVGNATSIHLELNPRASDADYTTAAERIRDIRAMRGKDLPLIPHRTWQATMCPGHYDLDRLDRMARGSTITPQGSITPTTPEEDELSEAAVLDIARIREILEAGEVAGTRASISAIDQRTALLVSDIAYVKGSDEPHLYERFQDNTIRPISGTEWELTGKPYVTYPQAKFNEIFKKA